jgi:hypothetical protein
MKLFEPDSRMRSHEALLCKKILGSSKNVLQFCVSYTDVMEPLPSPLRLVGWFRGASSFKAFCVYQP